MSKFTVALLSLTTFFTIAVHAETPTPSAYVLAPADTLEISFIGHKDLDAKQVIAPDGSVSLAVLGRIAAAGQTLDSFQTAITKKYAQYFQNPQLTVTLTPRSIYVTIYDLKTDKWETKEAKTIAEAQALAGPNYNKPINYGDVIYVDAGRKPDFWETNWYKVISIGVVLWGVVHR